MDLRRVALVVVGLLWGCGGGAAPERMPSASVTPPAATDGPPPSITPPAATPTAVPVAWAVGTIGGRGAVLSSADAGRSWNVVRLSSPADDRRTLGIAVADSRTIVVGGDTMLMRSGDAGASWTESDLRPPRDSWFDDVAFGDAVHGIAIGEVRSGDGFQPIYAITSDGGANWARLTFPFEDHKVALSTVCLTPQGAALTSGGGCWGDCAFVTLSLDFGATWRDVPIDIGSGAVACLDDGNLWAINGSSVLRSMDDGETWEVQGVVGPAPQRVTFAESGNGFGIDGNAILASTDGGASWTREAHPYDGTDATLGTIVGNGVTVLVGGSRTSSDRRVGVILVRRASEPGWIEAELPEGTDSISDLALTPSR